MAHIRQASCGAVGGSPAGLEGLRSSPAFRPGSAPSNRPVGCQNAVQGHQGFRGKSDNQVVRIHGVLLVPCRCPARVARQQTARSGWVRVLSARRSDASREARRPLARASLAIRCFVLRHLRGSYRCEPADSFLGARPGPPWSCPGTRWRRSEAGAACNGQLAGSHLLDAWPFETVIANREGLALHLEQSRYSELPRLRGRRPGEREQVRCVLRAWSHGTPAPGRWQRVRRAAWRYSGDPALQIIGLSVL